ncbi:MAG: 3-phosphoshikimate 1-carboxyvinyltransferase, partial [Parvularcula sp.]
TLPVTLEGAAVRPIRYRLPKPSAQIKSAVLLASLGANGTSVVEEPEACRDHTERMLPQFGVPVEIAPSAGGGRTISVTGPAHLKGTEVTVPVDPSSAAFPVAAAALVPGSDISVHGMLLGPTRTGFFETLREMGAALTIENCRTSGGEEVGDVHARASGLRGIDVPPERAPSMIDEYPILAVCAAMAEGTTRMTGIGEMRIKESDRIAATEAMLRRNGVTVRSGPDWLEVTGRRKLRGGAAVVTHHDHRIAMSALILGLLTEEPVAIDDSSMIDTSFPSFRSLMNDLGARIEPPVSAAA